MAYRLPVDIDNYLTRLRHMGVALYRSSYDLYSFWVSLMLYRPYRQAIKQQPQYMEIWRQMWLPDQYDKLEIQLDSQSSYDIPESVIGWLQGRWLRCGAVLQAWDKLPRI